MRVIDQEKTAANIRMLMARDNLKVVDVQRHFGFHSDNSVSKWRTGDTLPSIDNLVELTNLFNCKLDDIIATRDVK